jgi:DNA-binding CsgD family transcriptional regulator
MTNLDVLADYGDDHRSSVSNSAPLAVVDRDTGAIRHDIDSSTAPRPASNRSYESALISIFSHLFGPTAPGSHGPDLWGRPEGHGLRDDEQYQSIYVLAASLLASRRVAEAVKVLRQLDAIAAARPGWQVWRARSEFLWAMHAEQTGDLPAVLQHSVTASQLFRATAERPARENAAQLGNLLIIVDTVASERLPLLAARARIGLGEPQQAQAVLEDRYGCMDTAEAREPSLLARLACAQGRLSDAFRLATIALQDAEWNDLGAGLPTLEARLVLAEVFFERNVLDAAEEQLHAALRKCYATEAAPWVWTVQMYLARLWVAQERAIDTMPGLRHLRQLSQSALLPRHLVRDLNKIDIDCRLQLGDLEGAVHIVRDNPPHDFHSETLARVELCSGRPDRTVSALRTAKPTGMAAHVRRLILLACAEKQQGRAEQATASMGRAVDAARTEQYIRPFLELAAQTLPLLSSLGSSPSSHFSAQLLRQAEQVVSTSAARDDVTVLEPLSEREWQVLQHLASHRTQRQIASLMFVSTNTVKTHVKSIYRKTGAASRDEAVTIARGHGIIQASG